jgi:hypothetical protein
MPPRLLIRTRVENSLLVMHRIPFCHHKGEVREENVIFSQVWEHCDYRDLGFSNFWPVVFMCLASTEPKAQISNPCSQSCFHCWLYRFQMYFGQSVPATSFLCCSRRSNLIARLLVNHWTADCRNGANWRRWKIELRI